MQTIPQSERKHIAFFGRCNTGKSSLINRITGQEVSVVSPVAGTTTDAVRKPMELPDAGAVLLIDTPGLDDNSILGNERIRQTRRTIDQTDIAVVLFGKGDHSVELELVDDLRKRETSVIAVIAQCDILDEREETISIVEKETGLRPIAASAVSGEGEDELIRAIALNLHNEERYLTEGLCGRGDVVLLVMPQDKSAPKGRLIQPQVQTLRELLDRGCMSFCVTPEELPSALKALSGPPKLIITDSQAFAQVHPYKPEGTLLTSFSVLQARYKGDISVFMEGAKTLLNLKPSARILIAEACTHVPQGEDIGRVKLPRMLRARLGESIGIDIVGGRDFPDDLSGYDLIIHCGACMFNRKLVMSRIRKAQDSRVPITNYGIAIAALQGILDKINYL